MNVIDQSGTPIRDLVEKSFKKYDPGNYLYQYLIRETRAGGWNDNYFELLYTTLIAWRMNSRRAKLADYDHFVESIRNNEEVISSLKELRLEELSDSKFNDILKTQEKLFQELKLVETKSPLVTFSKTMHFLLPDLVVPMDRTYTMCFFFGSEDGGNFDKYKAVYREYYTYALNHPKLNDLKDNTWNLSLPKILDNIVIGYIMMKQAGRTEPFKRKCKEILKTY